MRCAHQNPCVLPSHLACNFKNRKLAVCSETLFMLIICNSSGLFGFAYFRYSCGLQNLRKIRSVFLYALFHCTVELLLQCKSRVSVWAALVIIRFEKKYRASSVFSVARCRSTTQAFSPLICTTNSCLFVYAKTEKRSSWIFLIHSFVHMVRAYQEW